MEFYYFLLFVGLDMSFFPLLKSEKECLDMLEFRSTNLVHILRVRILSGLSVVNVTSLPQLSHFPSNFNSSQEWVVRFGWPQSGQGRVSMTIFFLIIMLSHPHTSMHS